MYILGIDEAGRGPVVGPMVYAVAYYHEEAIQKLHDLKLADSKTLSPSRRETLFEKINQTDGLGFIVDIIPASEISSKMLQQVPTNLNRIAIESTFKLIKEVLKRGLQIKQVYVDTLGPPESHQLKLEREFPDLEFTVKKKADSIYPVVSMASIVAKVLRDREINQFQKTSDESLGSGYPSDQVTINWLKRKLDPVFGFPSEIRFSWSTCSNLLKEEGVHVDWNAKEDKKNHQLTLEQSIDSNKQQPVFFKSRKLVRVLKNPHN
eukprot:g4551.t1